MKSTQKQQGFIGPVEIVLVVAVIAIVGLIGWRIYDANRSTETVNRSAEEQTARELPAELGDVLTFDRIKELAIAESPEATVTGVELKNRNGTVVYEVTLSDGSVHLFNAVTGEKVTRSASDDNTAETVQDGHALPATFTVGISFSQAQKTALEKFPNSKIRKIELSLEEGKVVYSVRFTDDARVDVDASNGDVVRIKTPKAEERNEDRSDNSGSNDDSAVDDSTPTSNSSNSGSGSSSGSSGSGSGSDDDSVDDNSNNSNSGSGGDETRVEGVLTSNGGVYTVTQNGKTYTLQLSQDISNWVGKKVRAEGVMNSNAVIDVEKIELR